LFKLYGEMSLIDRTETFRKFCSVSSGVLLCTDVAARGLDMPMVDGILQYEAPSDVRTYVHRAGRTARLGTEGRALIFLHPSEAAFSTFLAGCGMSLTQLDIRSLMSHAPAAWKQNEFSWAMHVESMMHRDAVLSDLGRMAFQSTLRAYATHSKETKSIFHLKSLHLGHLAKSFGLTETPSQVANQLRNKREKASKAAKSNRFRDGRERKKADAKGRDRGDRNGNDGDGRKKGKSTLSLPTRMGMSRDLRPIGGLQLSRVTKAQ